MNVAATVNAILKAKGWIHQDMADAMGVSQPAVTRWAAGKSFPRGESYVKLMELAKSVLEDEPVDEARPVRAALVSTPLSGQVSAGLFQEVDELENQDPDEVLAQRDPRYPRARTLVFDVGGNSMNAFDPPIPDGSRVSGPAFEDINEKLQNGMAVVIERRSADGQMREWSVKELEVRDDGYTFHPRSTDPRYKPILVDTNLQADDGKTVEIIALVVDVTRPVRWRSGSSR
ncbi:transcriptional regulator with XRE-family HTH domain [Ancylobacter sp. 3268]|uniref:LexA family protein n=1 Tax=Ancylobacter sp. 3268 TaxID=2817752 RepID=UPI0028624DEE|nr:XRE family transcriptional regulator [Ancylobacter sp. 3268]MDR6953820.1 transcriptional regulator with XRE-family HTH domain [Ancylobacter sp. 3268]